MIDLSTGKPMTRRSALTGLAGILAAGVAPAAVVRSMLGARGVAMFGGRGAPTAKDYVQNGLVAIFDVKDNSDWGVHDASIQRINNLVNPSEYLSFSGDLSGDHITLVNTSTSTNLGISSFKSYDVVLSSANNSFWTYLISVGGYGIGSSTNAAGTIAFPTVRSAGDKVTYFISQEGGSWQKVYNQNEPSYFYRPCFRTDSPFNVVVRNSEYDGIIRTALYASQNRDVPQGGNFTIGNHLGEYLITTLFWSIRLYDRELTDLEIAANYAIDKVRFGIT